MISTTGRKPLNAIPTPNPTIPASETGVVITRPGNHDWAYAGAAFGEALPWLAARVHTPDVAPVAMPVAPAPAGPPPIAPPAPHTQPVAAVQPGQ